MGRISIDKINEGAHYEGYLWWSNKEDPERVYVEQPVSLPQEGDNPFVVEGQLYDIDNGKSYSIKYVDGEYHVYCHQVEPSLLRLGNNGQQEIKDSEGHVISVVERKDYLGNRMDGKLKFLRYWVAEPDENCDNMPVLKLTKNVFVGFEIKTGGHDHV